MTVVGAFIVRILFLAKTLMGPAGGTSREGGGILRTNPGYGNRSLHTGLCTNCNQLGVFFPQVVHRPVRKLLSPYYSSTSPWGPQGMKDGDPTQ